MKEANEILSEAKTVHERVEPHLRPAAEYFHEREGNLFERDEATDNLAEELDIERELASDVLSQLVSDTVDPVVQVNNHVGVIEFHEFDGAYGYVEYDDLHGQCKRVVCQQCVNEAELDSEVVHATAGDPHGSYDDVDYDELLDGVHQHYDDAHDVKPSEVETGATLASGTTIGGNTAYHAGTGLSANLDANTNDISNVGALDTESATITNVAGRGELTTDQIVTNDTQTKLQLDNVEIEHSDVVDVDLSNNRLQIQTSGTYYVNCQIRWAGSSNWSGGDRLAIQLLVNGNRINQTNDVHHGFNQNRTQRATASFAGENGDNITVNLFQKAGQDESLDGFSEAIYLEVIRLG